MRDVGRRLLRHDVLDETVEKFGSVLDCWVGIRCELHGSVSEWERRGGGRVDEPWTSHRTAR